MKTIEEVQGKVNSTKTGTTIKVTIMRSDDGTYKEKEVNVTLKGKDTVDGLEDSTTQQQPNDSQNYGDDSEIVPWGRVFTKVIKSCIINPIVCLRWDLLRLQL